MGDGGNMWNSLRECLEESLYRGEEEQENEEDVAEWVGKTIETIKERKG